MTEIRPLTGLRFLAAFYVFIMHMDMRVPFTFLHDRVRELIGQGALGVTVFFVLSGFVLTYAHLKDFPTAAMPTRTYYAGFLYKRLARLYPAYLVGLLVCMALAVRLGSLDWFDVTVNATFLQPWFPSTLGKWYGAGSWSVSAEMFFYLLFPFTLPLLLRTTRSVLWLVLASCVLGGTALGVGSMYGLNGGIVYNLPLTRLPEFGSGIVAGILILRHRWRVPAWLPILLVAACACYLTDARKLSGGTLAQFWIVIPTVVVMIAAMAQRQSAFEWLGQRPWRYLGQTSYCFYIVQLPLLLTLDALQQAGRVSHTELIVLPVLLVANLVGAVLVHELVEKPAHRWLMNRYQVRKHQAQVRVPN